MELSQHMSSSRFWHQQQTELVQC